MSGFSADWLSLREPVDHRSINPQLRARFVQHFADRNAAAVADLGSGSGSSLRALAPYLPQRQTWYLADHDPALLAHAREALSAWAEKTESCDGRLLLEKAGKRVDVCFVQADLGESVPAALLDEADVVTSSAFFDLVSGDWIARFAASLAARRLPLYAMLTYDGIEIWQPPHRCDAAMLAAFHADQHRDKGFGPAAGPDAVPALESALFAHTYDVMRGDSPWLLDSADSALIAALAEGSATAIAASGKAPAPDIASWRLARVHALGCTIGHADILALPR